MSIFAVLTTLSFLVELSQTSTICTLGSFAWASNSLDQDPCEVAAYLISPCYGYKYPISPISPGGGYTGPYVNDGNTCKCSSVVYSALSACGACQGGHWFSWVDYTPNCDGTNHSIPYAFAIPNGTSVPYWTRIDVTAKGTWDPDESRAVGNTPEAGPGALINTPAASAVVSSSPQATHSPTATSSKSSGSSSNAGAIAGGVIGGVVVISAIAFVFFLLGRRMHRQGFPTPPVLHATLQPLMGEVRPQPSDYEFTEFVTPSLPETPTPPLRLYDPEDPTTYRLNQGANPVPQPHTQDPGVSDTGHNLHKMQTPPPIYRPLPTV